MSRLFDLSERFMLFITILFVIVLVASALGLITTQYRVRLLVGEIDRAKQTSLRLTEDSSQLALDLSKAALPMAVTDRAHSLGFAPADVSNTVLLAVDPATLDREQLEVRK